MEYEVGGHIMYVAHHFKLILHERRHRVRRLAETLSRVFGDHAIRSGGWIGDEPHVGIEVHLMRRIEDAVSDPVYADRIAIHVLGPRRIHVLPYPRNLRRRQIACAEILAECVALCAERERRILLQERILRKPRHEIRLGDLCLNLETMPLRRRSRAADDVDVVL